MKRFFAISIIMILFFAGLKSINAQMKERFGKDKPNVIEKLNLTDKQLETFNNYKFDAQEKAIDLHAQIQKNNLEIKKLMAADELDQSKIMALTKTNNSLKNQIQESRMQMWMDIYNSLDDTQKEIWKESRQKFGDKSMFHGNRRGQESFCEPGSRMGRMDDNRGMKDRRGMNPDRWRN